MSLPGQVNLTPVIQGDTWDGLTVSFSSTGTAFADTLSTVKMTFKDSTGTTALALTSASASEILITDSITWTFNAVGRILSLAADTYSWGIETTDAGGVTKTRLTGTLKILADPV